MGESSILLCLFYVCPSEVAVSVVWDQGMPALTGLLQAGCMSQAVPIDPSSSTPPQVAASIAPRASENARNAGEVMSNGTQSAVNADDSAPAGSARVSGPVRRGRYRDEARRFYTLPPVLRGPGIILLLAAGCLFYWTIGRMWLRWNSLHSYYSHGPLILPIAIATAWLIIRNRGLPMHSTRGSRTVGIALLVVALLIHLASMYALVTFVSGFMMLPVLAGCVLYLGGWPMLSRLWFPIAFLAFMVPLPDLTIADINFRLKMMAANVSTAIVNGIGIPTYLKGAEIYLGGGKHLTVEDACSGLRSLISLLAFATLFTYACKLRGYKRLALFVSAVPVAVAANIVRIVVLTIVANNGSVALATPGGWVHDMMGFVVFVIAFCFLFLMEELLDLLPGATSDRWLGSGLWKKGS
jgi:exosortase